VDVSETGALKDASKVCLVVASEMSDPRVANAKLPLTGRDADEKSSARSQKALPIIECSSIILDVLKHFESTHDVELAYAHRLDPGVVEFGLY
jgi:hypothetical protein